VAPKKLPPEVLEFFRKQGAKGGKMSAASLSAEERAERARKATAGLTAEERAERARAAALKSAEVRRAKANEKRSQAEEAGAPSEQPRKARKRATK